MQDVLMLVVKNHSVLIVNCFDAGPDIYIVRIAGCFDVGCNTDSVRILLVTVPSSRPVLRTPLRPIRPGTNLDCSPLLQLLN